MLTCSQWLVLYNLKHRWPYATNLAREFADPAYQWCVEKGYVEDGRITAAGEGALIACPYPKGK